MLATDTPPEVDFVDATHGARLLDQQAREQLGISGEEFIRRYRSGDLRDFDQSEVVDVALLLPFAGESLNSRKHP